VGSQHEDAGRRSRRASAGRSAERREDAVVRRLQALGADLATTPTADHRAATRARLVAMAAVRPPAPDAAASGPTSLRRGLLSGGASDPRWRTRATAGLAGAALSVSTFGGLLAASQGAGPSDLLYDVKRGGERAQLALAGDARGSTLLDFATTRLTELSELTQGGVAVLPAAAGSTTVLAAGAASGVVVDTLAVMDDQTAEGAWWVTTRSVTSGEEAGLTELASWAADQAAGLAALGGAVPITAGPALDASTDLVAAVADRATGLSEALGCATGPATSGTDELGPLPAACPSPTSRSGTDGGPRIDPAPPPPAPSAGAQAAEPPPAGAAAVGPAPRAANDGPPGRDGGHLRAPYLPSGPRTSIPGPAPPSAPPVVDLPLPVCVSTLGLPVLC
jgi:hypothetical protein